MEIIDLIRSHLTPQATAAYLMRRPPAQQVIRRRIYGDEGVQHPFAIINLADLMRTLSNVPVVRRGSQAYALNRGDTGFTFIEPQGFDLSHFLTAADIQNFKLLSSDSVQTQIENLLNDMLITIQTSTEALCAQSLSGQLRYPMKTELGTEVYEVNYGAPQRYTPETMWDSVGAKVAHVYETISDMHAQLQSKGFGGSTVTMAGRRAFSQLVALADDSKSNIVQVKIVAENEVSVGGYTVVLENSVYKSVGNTMEQSVAPNALCMVDKSAGHKLYYLALDDLESGLLPMPFFASQSVKTNPSGLEIVGRSKPLPAPVMNAICWADVLSPTRSGARTGSKKAA